MCRQLFLVLFLIWVAFLFARNRESTHFYRMSSCRAYSKRQLVMYAAYAILILIVAMSTLSDKISHLPLVAVWLAVLYAPIVWFKPAFTIYYSKKDAELFRSELEKDSKGPTDISKATYQTTMMPFYKDEARTQMIGRLYSSAEIYAIDSIRQNEVIQCTTYVFEGTDPDFPKGTITMQIENKNDIHDIFPPSNTYRGYILSGSHAYAGLKGTVDVNITDDKRRAVFTH